MRAARIWDFRRQERELPTHSAPRAAYAYRHDVAYHRPRTEPVQRQTMDELTRLSERLVVMSEYGAALLREVHGVDEAKIDVIPHGIPGAAHAEHSKDRLGVEGHRVILTFGLLSPDKGIEHVIEALPFILARHPKALYVVLGATHPRVKEQRGETYRLSLEARALRLGVDSSLIFHDRFVSAPSWPSSWRPRTST